MHRPEPGKAYFHLPGLFEFYELYRLFLPYYFEHREFFYPDFEIASLYGAPRDCLWGGGRISDSTSDACEVLALTKEFGLSARLCFSNSLLREEHLSDRKCNALCALFEDGGAGINGVIVHSELLLAYLKQHYPGLYFVSSTTKVLTDFVALRAELMRPDFAYVVPDFRLNKAFSRLETLPQDQKDKLEFLCNECCDFACPDRKLCYENVSRRNLGEETAEHVCRSAHAREGYRFSAAMKNPGYIGPEAIRSDYLPRGFSQFKLEGRGLGSALVFEFLLHYLAKPEHQLELREAIYLDPMLDLF